MSDREVRDLLEATQVELEQARERLKVLEAQSTEALQERLAQLEADSATMHARLEQGDAVRESWAARQASLERELAISRTEQQRLQSRLETVALERKLGRGPGLSLGLVLAGGGVLSAIGVAVALLFRLLLHH